MSKLKYNGERRMVTRQMAADERDSRNPLHLPELLENVLEFLPMEDLKSCRLVNTFWKDTALKPMKTKCGAISFPYNKDYPVYSEGLKRMEKFLHCFSVDPDSGLLNGVRDDIPCTKFEVSTRIIKKWNTNRDKSILVNFLQAISPWVTEITLYEGNDIGRFLSEKKMKQINVLKFTSLKHVSFSSTGLLGYEDVSSAFSPWMSIFITNAPQLEKLDFSRDGCSRKERSSFLQVLKHNQGLKDLNICCTMEDNDVIHLSESNLKLKSLTLTICNFSTKRVGFLPQLLKSQSDSLESFTIINWCDGVAADVPIPILKNLNSLAIHGCCPGLINYAEQMPSLERVVLGSDNWSKYLNEEMKPAPIVKELCFFCSYDYPTAETIREAVRIFPNISKLEISVENDLATIVYDSLPDLEELTLTSNRGGSIDGLLTGLTEEGCQNALRKLRDWTPDFDDSEIEIGINHSPISVLTKLKLLRLRNRWQKPGELEISEVSLWLALIKMPSLRILDLSERSEAPDESIPSALINEFRKNRLILWKLKNAGNRGRSCQFQGCDLHFQ